VQYDRSNVIVTCTNGNEKIPAVDDWPTQEEIRVCGISSVIFYLHLKNMIMNKTVNFGYHSFALGYVVKLNVKLRKIDAEQLRASYPNVATINNGNRGYRLEGYISDLEMSKFHDSLQMMKLDYKIEAMMNTKAEMLCVNLPQIDLDPANFDEI
jgi:hypothetical protein